MSARQDVQIGKTYRVSCPFYREKYMDAEGYERPSWRPGVVWEIEGPEDYCHPRAHGMGWVEYRVVAISELPKPYPARVFFLRKWVSPAGTRFGHGKLRIMTMGAFKRRLQSYIPAGVSPYHEIAVADLTPEQRLAA